MAEQMFRPPSQLDIIDCNVSENYGRWKREIEIYLVASGAKDKSKEAQTAIILHCAGSKVIEIFDQFVFASADDNKDPEIVLQKLEEYCNPRKNEVVESHRFWSVPFQQNFEPFLTEIRASAENFNFKDQERMLRDKIVFSMSGKIQELLLREDKLDFEECSNVQSI